ncbi:MAG: YdcF family protein [Aerococcaceae bacterium]|nr:YdcF family protein [Aerococcaceae bacterium]
MYFNVVSVLTLIGLLIAKSIQGRRFVMYPIVWSVYGLTGVVLLLFQNSSWTPISLFRYFLYIVSIFMMVGVPFLLVVLVAITVMRSAKGLTKPLWKQPLSLATSILCIGFVLFTLWGLTRRAPFAYARFISIYMMIAIYFSAIFLSFLVLIPIIHFFPQKKHYQTIVVLGTEIGEEGEVLDTLKRRLDAAWHYYKRQPLGTQHQMTFIVSGGVVKADVSEAEQMKRYLTQKGIPEQQILCEMLSRNTYENFIYSAIIKRNYHLSNQALIITSKFHLVRAAHLAKVTHFQAVFKGSTTAWYLWPYCVVREYLAFLVLTRDINYGLLSVIIIQGILQVLT